MDRQIGGPAGRRGVRRRESREGNNILDSPPGAWEDSLTDSPRWAIPPTGVAEPYYVPLYGWREWLDAVGSGFSERHRDGCVLVMLTAYMDDSGSEGTGPVFVLAGYAAPIKVWKAFSSEWEQTLAKPPALPYFKMREARRLHDCFEGWSEKERDQRIAELSGVISKQPIISGLVLVMSWADFRQAKAEHPEVTDCRPYDMLFHGLMATTTRLLVEERSREPIEYVFDEQEGAGERAILTYKQIRSVLPPAQANLVVGSPRMENDKIVLPLQAADLLAWQVRRYVAENGSFPLFANGERLPLPDKYSDFARLLQNQIIYRRYDYAAIKRIYRVWTKPLSEIAEIFDEKAPE